AVAAPRETGSRPRSVVVRFRDGAPRRAQAEDSRCSRTRWPEVIPRAASTRTAVWRIGGAARRARLRLGKGDAGTQARHDLQPVVVSFEELPCRRDRGIRYQQKAGLHGEVQVRNVGGVDAEELRRRDPGHRERDVVDPNGLSWGRFCTSAAALTEAKLITATAGAPARSSSATPRRQGAPVRPRRFAAIAGGES